MGGDCIVLPEALLRGLFGLTLRRDNGGFRGDCPIISNVNGKGGSHGNVEEGENNYKYDDRGVL